MKYIANPVEVDARKILAVGELRNDGSRQITVAPDDPKATTLGVADLIADAGMLARMMPVPGDYVVLQADGYLYLNPKDVFERKYRPDLAVVMNGVADHARMQGIRGAVARGWCYAKNSAKEFDSDLAEAIVNEVAKLLEDCDQKVYLTGSAQLSVVALTVIENGEAKGAHVDVTKFVDAYRTMSRGQFYETWLRPMLEQLLGKSPALEPDAEPNAFELGAAVRRAGLAGK